MSESENDNGGENLGAIRDALSIKQDPIELAIAQARGAQGVLGQDGEASEAATTAEADDATDDSTEGHLTRLLAAVHEVPKPGNPWHLYHNGEWIDMPPGKWAEFGFCHERTLLPRNCMVVPLGYSKEGSWFLDPQGSMVMLGKNAGKGDLDHLFAPFDDYLLWAWPQLKPVTEKIDGKVVVVDWDCDNYKAELARKALFRAAALKGKFDPINKTRGRGVWRDREGGVIFHGGNRVLYKNTWHRPGEIDGYIYTAKPPIGKPANTPSVVDVLNAEMAMSAQMILKVLKTWAWERPGLDPYLVFGFIVSCRVCGALKARPGCWISGETNAGKSELFRLIRFLMDEGMVGVEKASAASIYQNLGEDCLAVLLDEQENSEDRRIMKAILDLILVSFTGGSIGKGGQDGVPINYTLRSSFLMSGIVQASMSTANENRMVSLMIRTLPPEQATGVVYDEALMKAASADVFGRVLKGWDRLSATVETVRRFLALKGYEGRHQDTYGTLIACAHVAMFDHAIEDGENTPLGMGLSWWGNQLPAIKAKKNWHDLWGFLMEAPIEAYRTTAHPNVEAIIQAAVKPADTTDDAVNPIILANRRLGLVGLFLRERDVDGVPALDLFIPNRHEGLARWLRDTIWGGGSGETGAWQGILKQIPFAEKATVKRAIYGKTVEGVFVDLAVAAKAFE